MNASISLLSIFFIMHTKEQLLTKKILNWYDLNKRSLPWRKDVSFKKKQYYTLVSEFMLQQTQVVTVIPYFKRFIKFIPNLNSLAKVKNEKLIKLWEGLGYYSRARNLKKTAQLIIKNFKGNLPNNFDDLTKLPGIGNYTASAILAIVFNRPYIPLDGNIERVLKRYLYLKKEKEIQKSNLIEKKNIFGKSLRSSDYAQALMELGALICKPTNPICNECPISKNCKSYKKKDFNLICNHIKKLKGKLVLMGVGKSGHIAAKISSTLSSTGTPSFFINPSEASHGDLGAISKNDGILIISNSGETDEIVLILSGLMKKTKNILSITGNEESSIAKKSLVHLEAKVDKEACPNNLAPTTSTSFMLMLGDAISIALLKNNRFSPKEFAENHPGGKLGKRFLLAKDLMIDIKEIPIVKENTSILEAIKVITQFGLGFCLVKNSKQSINAIFTDGDLRRTLNKKIDIRNLSISKVMTKSFKSIEHNKNAYLAREIMSKNKIYSLVVKKQKKVIGVIRMHELNESRVF